ncbi:hypothetical protein ANO11243_071750 [Dothideomycetidae sp. 11243]|nr:hypothetical protein ANO11243_071750 [fungal sp. No.11243]
MFSNSFLVAVSALSALAVASPIASEQQGLTFSLTRQATVHKSKVSPAMLAMRVHDKYNVAPSAELVAALSSQEGSVNATNIEEVTYNVPLTIGSQTFNLIFDTGSSDLWVYSNRLPSSETAGHDVYKPGKTASLMKGSTFKISYVGGDAATGLVYADKVAFGAATVTRQAVEAATSINKAAVQQFNEGESDGILGMASSHLNTIRPTQQTTLFDTIKSSLASPVFTTKFLKLADGAIDFGFIDSSKYVGNITYVPVNPSPGFWRFHVGGYSIGSTAGTARATIGACIADTGTSLMYLPNAVVSEYWARVKGAAYDKTQHAWLFPCSHASSLPDFNLDIAGGHTVTVPGEEMNLGQVTQGSAKCYGGLQNSNGEKLNILGDVFLRASFMVWDRTESVPRLGFAKPNY